MPEQAWQVGPQVAQDVPVGLTNIANTCYLNSLLQVSSRSRTQIPGRANRFHAQYFFTVRDLREAILQYKKPEPATGAELNRVGGRAVTQAEVERSMRCESGLFGWSSEAR